MWKLLQHDGKDEYCSMLGCTFMTCLIVIKVIVISLLFEFQWLKPAGIKVFAKHFIEFIIASLSFLFTGIVLKLESAHIGRVEKHNDKKAVLKISISECPVLLIS